MKSLKIKNFKCFQNIEIPLNRLTIMAGANANGKSTAIQALLFLRKTIEQKYSILGEEYKLETLKLTVPEDLSTPIALNKGYMLSLGTSSYVLNQLSNISEIVIGISSQVEGEEIIAEYHTDNTASELFLESKTIRSSSSEAVLSLRMKEFYYLNAERIGPRVNQSIQHFDFPHTGYQGEYVAQLITMLNYEIKIDENRRHPNNKNPRLESQINAWLDELMPGVNIIAVQSLETMTAQIKVENYYTKGEPILATNIGFGISYVLPIIATGLIAKEGSFLIVENPEAHLHPSAQSKIGHFLATIAQSGVNVIIETHSDHVVNGIQVSVVKQKINSDLIAINFFNQMEDETQPNVENIKINNKGELSKWPKGFFDQTQIDYAELYKITKNG